MSVKRLNMHEAKTHLSRYVGRLEPGDRIILCRRNQPVAEIRPLAERSERPRQLNQMKGAATLPASFWEPLPEEIRAAFEGRGT